MFILYVRLSTHNTNILVNSFCMYKLSKGDVDIFYVMLAFFCSFL
jgi:hypothetical protein